MNNIILQHFNGDLRELDQLSVDNISAYANNISADYQLVTGKPFYSHLTDPCQKSCIINEQWDDYDNVLMIDIDCFIAKDLKENVFDVTGNGIHNSTQLRLKNRLIKLGRIKKSTPYWSGSFYKFSKEERQMLRSVIPENTKWMDLYNKPYNYEDEGILSELAMKANLPERYLGIEWNQCSFLPEPEKAKILHIRTKKPGHPNGTWENGGKQDKIINYKELVSKGII